MLLAAALVMLPTRHSHRILSLSLVGGIIALSLIQTLAGVAGLWVLVTVLDFVLLLQFPAAVAAWMVTRMRPGVAFALLPISLVAIALHIFLLTNTWGVRPVSVIGGLVLVGILVGIAWLARLIASMRGAPVSPAERAATLAAQQHAARVAHVQQWEAAYAAAHGGEAPPPGTVVPPMAAMPATAGTNVMAILALVFGLGGGLLGILFGHLALSQIKRTGEQGRGLALAGLICGYVGAGALLIMLLFWVGLLLRF